MCSTKLKEDLRNCLITFDRRVLITELMDKYSLEYEVVNKVVMDYIKQQENKDKSKYEKRYVVHGLQEGEIEREIYKIVEEQKLKEWLKKLKDSESFLYSVEIVGGAKAPAPVFKPMRVQEGVKLKEHKDVKMSTTNGSEEISKTADPIGKNEFKTETKKTFQEKSGIKKKEESPKTKIDSEKAIKKSSPHAEVSLADKKTTDKTPVAKKGGGINNFFAPVSSKKPNSDIKDSKSIVKPTTPKKDIKDDRKQIDKPKTAKESLKKQTGNTSIQLFDDNDDEKEETEEESSDEEEKLEALKRDIISSDVEINGDEDSNDKSKSSVKRRRILDSDDDNEEEEPPVKQEKLDVQEEIKEEEEEQETYLDEEGFVITKKSKQKASNISAGKSQAIKKTPPVTIKNSPKESKKSNTTANKETKGSGNPTVKTKQANIMSFFSKK